MTLKIINVHAAADCLPDAGIPVHGAPAVGLAMHTNGHLGVDMLHVKAGEQFPVHTHPGDHLLYCVRGEGTITVAEITYRVIPGDIYMVDGAVPHAVGAYTDHWLLAIGAPHKAVDATDRMAFVNWDGTPADNPLLIDPDNRMIAAGKS